MSNEIRNVPHRNCTEIDCSIKSCARPPNRASQIVNAAGAYFDTMVIKPCNAPASNGAGNSHFPNAWPGGSGREANGQCALIRRQRRQSVNALPSIRSPSARLCAHHHHFLSLLSQHRPHTWWRECFHSQDPCRGAAKGSIDRIILHHLISSFT